MAADATSPETRAKARELADRVLRGDLRAAARVMRFVDDERPLGLAVLAILHREGPEARLIGVTGAPGAGKSTLIDQLIAHYRAKALKVGVVAIDPSSPISGGAVLADRVRMQRHTLDEGVFVRSLSSRGATGGLSASASASARVLEALGFDVVIIETVGIGQSEVDIAQVADTVIAVLAPGLGDDVQAMKAGLLEIPDVFVVNKADRDGADHVVRDLELMIHLREPTEPEKLAGRWSPPVVKTIAAKGEGVATLADALDRHAAWLAGAPSGARETERTRRRVARARLDVETAVLRHLRAMMLEAAGGHDAIEAAARRIAARTSDPVTELEALLGRARLPWPTRGDR
ncbi:methylmalonyl Co-A mutase-associated GTPase MeaB [Myxococcota bacterium]|nr:methylmalonyl Co-A mutase-associated GTPase MeaB [Myxococcota bacterium]